MIKDDRGLNDKVSYTSLANITHEVLKKELKEHAVKLIRGGLMKHLLPARISTK